MKPGEVTDSLNYIVSAPPSHLFFPSEFWSMKPTNIADKKEKKKATNQYISRDLRQK